MSLEEERLNLVKKGSVLSAREKKLDEELDAPTDQSNVAVLLARLNNVTESRKTLHAEWDDFNRRAAAAESEAAGGVASNSGDNAEHKRPLSASVREEIIGGLRRLCTLLSKGPIDGNDEFLIFPPSLPKVIPKPLRTSIYIRPLYRDVLAAIDKAGSMSGIIITGNPGIGKSAMAPLIVHHFARQRFCVVYAYKDDLLGDLLFKLDFTDPAAVHVDVAKDDGELRHNWAAHDNALLILDGKAPEGHHTGRARTIVLSSPTVENWTEYRKGSDTSVGAGVKVLYLDVWHPLEVEKARAKLYTHVTTAEAADRYISFGGCVRLVLTDQNTTWEEVSKQFGAEHVEQLGNLQVVGFRSNISHNLIHIWAGRTLKLEYIQLASHKVAHLALQLLAQHERDNVRKTLIASAGKTSMAGWLGMVFEQHGHVAVPNGMTLYKRQLLPPTPAGTRRTTTRTRTITNTSSWAGTKRSKPCDDELQDRAHATHHYATTSMERPQAASQATTPPVAALVNTADEAMRQLQLGSTGVLSGLCEDLPALPTKWVTPDLDLSALSDCYLQPISANNASWDAVICMTHSDGKRRFLILQYTLSSEHGVRVGPIVQLLERLQVGVEDTVHMVFVVPDIPVGLYESYRYQSWLGVQGKRLQGVPTEVAQLEQWVFRLPVFPERHVYKPPSNTRADMKPDEGLEEEEEEEEEQQQQEERDQ